MLVIANNPLFGHYVYKFNLVIGIALLVDATSLMNKQKIVHSAVAGKIFVSHFLLTVVDDPSWTLIIFASSALLMDMLYLNCCLTASSCKMTSVTIRFTFSFLLIWTSHS